MEVKHRFTDALIGVFSIQAGANLRSANLRSANLGGANLGGANLGGANLYGANLRSANLGYAASDRILHWRSPTLGARLQFIDPATGRPAKGGSTFDNTVFSKGVPFEFDRVFAPHGILVRKEAGSV